MAIASAASQNILSSMFKMLKSKHMRDQNLCLGLSARWTDLDFIFPFPPSCIRALTGPKPGFQTGIIVSLFSLWRCWRCERCRHVFDDRRRIVSGRLISNRKSRNVATFHRINQIALRSAADGFAHWFFYRWRRLRECRRRQQEHDNSQFVHFIP
jgi:hypothetical protein